MNVKVNVAELIARLQDRKRQLRAEHQLAVEKYPELVELYRDKLVVALRRELTRQERSGALPRYASWYEDHGSVTGVYVLVPAVPPTKPSRPDVKAIDRRIAELRLESREAITIDPSSREWSWLLTSSPR